MKAIASPCQAPEQGEKTKAKVALLTLPTMSCATQPTVGWMVESWGIRGKNHLFQAKARVVTRLWKRKKNHRPTHKSLTGAY